MIGDEGGFGRLASMAVDGKGHSNGMSIGGS